VSGAPKVRAMQIIDELETVRRGPYAGAIGYLSYGGDLDTCICIRTAVIKDRVAYLQAGAGIVADSDPAREYEETRQKAAALVRAVDLAHEQFPGKDEQFPGQDEEPPRRDEESHGKDEESPGKDEDSLRRGEP